MAEYRIVAKVDPQTGAGTQKVKQDLRGVQSEARATEAAINRSFDQSRFEKSIGALINRLDRLEKSMASSGRTAGAAAKETDRAAISNKNLENALARVLRATDAEAAEQARLNALLVDAKRLLDVVVPDEYLQSVS